MPQSCLEHGIELALRSNSYPHVLEFGVWRGNTLKVLRDRFPESTHKVFGFDSFMGLPEDWPGTECNKGHFSTEGIAPAIPGTIILPGWFDNSLEIYQEWAKPISLLHLDCDLYSSTATVLARLDSYINWRTIIVCDEWIYTGLNDVRGEDQEQKAVWEWARLRDRAFEIVEFTDETDHGYERRILRVTR